MNPKRYTLAAAALALLMLGGCAIQIQHHEKQRADSCPLACNRAEPTRPQISVDASTGIRLNTELLAFRTGTGPFTITWSLDPKTAERYRFDPRAGIVIEGRLLDEVLEVGKRRAVALGEQDQIADCKPADKDATTYTCTNRATTPGLFKYTIRLVDRQTGTALVKDPPILNW